MNIDIKELVDRAMDDGEISSTEYETIMDAIHKDGKISDEEREQLSVIFKLAQEGKIKVID